MTLQELEIGQLAIIKSVGGDGALRQHFLDMGIIPNTKIKLIKLAPLGDPMEFRLPFSGTMRHGGKCPQEVP